MNPTSPGRMSWIARCFWRLKRHYLSGAPIPCGDRGLTWPEYVRLVACVLAEYREE